MTRPKHLSDLNDFRKKQVTTEQLRRYRIETNRIRVKAVGRHVPPKQEREAR